jgi:hypothetical protein
MIRTSVKTFQHKVGKNRFIVVKIFQTSTAKASGGNALASNAANVRIFKKHKKQR